MKNSEVKELSLKDLKERIESEKETLVRLKMNHVVSPLDNPIKLRDARKNIARLLTELRKRDLNPGAESKS
jgi:large subunit ribosomal protein L29